MKTLIPLILFTVFIRAQIVPNWYSVNPFPQENIHSVKFLNPLTGYACGEKGLLIKTTNAGKPWIPLISGINNNLYSVYFQNVNTGLAAGDNGILLKTTNAGNNWYITSVPSSTRITELFFIDSSNGFASAFNGIFLKTSNSGLNWSSSAVSSKNLRAVFFLNSNTGFLAGDSGIVLKTTNGGINWNLSYIVNNLNVHSIYFLNSLTGFAIFNGGMYRTENGGENWVFINSGYSGYFEPNGDIKFINPNTGYLISGNGPLIKTTNSGTNWTVGGPSNVAQMTALSMSIVDSLNIFIAAINGLIYKTRSDSLNYFHHIGGIRKPFYYVSFINENTGIIHNAGEFIRTSTGGNTWDISSSSFNNWFEPGYTEFKNAVNNGINFYRVKKVSGMMSFSSQIERSTDYGLTWNAPGGHGGQLFYEINDLRIKNEMAYAITSFYSISGFSLLTSINAGTWNVKYSVTNKNLFKVSFANQSTGMLIAFNSGSSANKYLLRTTNGGNNWDSMPMPVYRNVRNIEMCSGGSGFIFYDSGYVSRSTNFGANWFTYFVSNLISSKAYQFLNDNTGYALSSTNKLLFTSNGGLNWSVHETGATKALYAFSFVNQNTGYITGDSGVVLKTTNGGLTFMNPMKKNIPDRFYLYQNYPNPFNPVTKIRFDIPNMDSRLRLKAGGNDNVVLNIYNSLGQIIESQSFASIQPGTYEYEFDGSNYPSGIYFYQLTAGDLKETRKMVLLK